MVYHIKCFNSTTMEGIPYQPPDNLHFLILEHHRKHLGFCGLFIVGGFSLLFKTFLYIYIYLFFWFMLLLLLFSGDYGERDVSQR